MLYKRILRPVITISRQCGAGGHAVAGRLVARLDGDWEISDKEIIGAVAHSAQVRSEMIKKLDERTQSTMEDIIQSMFKPRGEVLESLGYRRHLVQALLALAYQGHKIIVGRGANFILPDALNVRLEASEAFRLHMTMERYKVSRGQALEMMSRLDHERALFTRSIFNRDISDPGSYEMVLQTDKLGLDTAAAVIAAAWKEKWEPAIENIQAPQRSPGQWQDET